ncbi:hypothetical protein LJC56_05335 [Christensenellaceae bacterium OttesenSCG-928-K19]|nr:hypothetical protein [Christensenellaceae bacterium OttesenSCG-928-K19]
MKRKYVLLGVVLILLVAVLCSCGVVGEIAQEAKNIMEAQDGRQMTIDDDGTVEVFYGTYQIPQGWEYSEKYTIDTDALAGKLFFIKSDVEPAGKYPTNISIEYGTNSYGVEDHERFRDSILAQLQTQMTEGDGILTGAGSYTAQGYRVYRFGIGEDESEDGISTVQYYIVGDRQYVMVHMTDFHDPSVLDADEAAQQIVDSFIWIEDEGNLEGQED